MAAHEGWSSGPAGKRSIMAGGHVRVLEALGAALVLVSAPLGAAQQQPAAAELPVRIVAASSGDPVPDASVSLLTGDSVLVDYASSNEEGRASLEAPPGTYRILVERMDLEPWTSDPLTVEAGPSEERTIRVPLRPVTLPGLDVATEDGRCPGTREERRRGYERYREVVGALRPVARLEASDRYVFQVRVEEGIFSESEDLDTLAAPPREALVGQPVATLDAATLVARGYIQPGEGTRLEYYPPTAGVIVAESFARAHCFRAIEDEAEDRVGLAFTPLPDREPPDVEGEVWLEAKTRAPLRLDFTYTGLNRILGRYEVPRIVADVRRRATDRRRGRDYRIRREDTRVDEDDYGGRLTFDRIEAQTWITRRWRIRLPILWQETWWRANSRTPTPPEVQLRVNAVPLERTGLVRGVGRVRGDSTVSEGTAGDREQSPGDGGGRK